MPIGQEPMYDESAGPGLINTNKGLEAGWRRGVGCGVVSSRQALLLASDFLGV